MRDSIPTRRPAPGFTLVEVLVAAAVLALALAAVFGVVRDQAARAADLRDRTLAHWAAVDRVHELRLAPDWPAPGRSSGRVELAGRMLHWVAEVRATPDPDIRGITVLVRGEADGPLLARSEGWVSPGNGTP